ncbi:MULTISPECIES: hypothetical protein [unclassified Chryseobacterium]|uniref:hypothetical protein n=1 Tax=unclassified Chryseobacterium TaxID=2593645 RepID=UPI000A8A75F9|nr:MULTISPECIES: hypothetical protein [unclassified Chryseobacterium]
MKSLIMYSVSVIVSWIWLYVSHQTFNPILLKGPDFLKFYVLILMIFYLMIFIGKRLKINNRKVLLYFMLSIIALGITKLFRGLYLNKPVGYLIFILIMETIVMLIITQTHPNHKLK